MAATSGHVPTARPAANAAPKAVVSGIDGRSSGGPCSYRAGRITFHFDISLDESIPDLLGTA